MIFAQPLPPLSPGRARIAAAGRLSETAAVAALLDEGRFSTEQRQRIESRARALVLEARKRRLESSGLDAFLSEFGLSTPEGVVLMCLAEALLRIPDAATADRLIHDKIGEGQWEKHLGRSPSLFVNASTWALMLTGKVIRFEQQGESELAGAFKRLVAGGSDPIIRRAMIAAMRILGRQFVMGRTIDEALDRAVETERLGYRYSYDMLGEAAYTARDASRYFDAYERAIAVIGRKAGGRGPIEGPGISVKLSAIHPRYEFAQADRVRRELTPRLLTLAQAAKKAGIGFTVDAEEAERLELSLDVIEAVFKDPSLSGWEGFGLAVQAYQKRAPAVIDWLGGLASAAGRQMMVRLVKGAYWDTEIKRAQERGLDAYPVFSRKVTTDLSYLVSARHLLAAGERIFPQFATHNAHTLAAIVELAGARPYELQRLHGMGEELYSQVVGPGTLGLPCRIYAPVGSHEDLLPYLVRRLLENGANTSFVNRLADEQAPIEAIIADPAETVAALAEKPHQRIPLPADLFAPERRNSAGLDLNEGEILRELAPPMAAAAGRRWSAQPLIGGGGPPKAVHDPSDNRRILGEVTEAGPAAIEAALVRAASAAPGWSATAAAERAAALERAADLYERHRPELMALLVREAGRTIPDALGEVREAVDFCRYYAAATRADFAAPRSLPGPTGGRNELALHGRGVFACISPWNFPLAIFTGQVAAALAAGNAAIAKPAEQTPLIGMRAVELLHEAGIPADVLHLLPGDGPAVGARLIADPRIAGVAFTGSTETARAINQSLAARKGPIVPLIAETGGLNAMIVDSSALAEQVVRDTLASAFNSAGQRCSALRVLFLQEEVADRVIEMLAGAMAELTVGDPGLIATDVGPVIDAAALGPLQEHARRMAREAAPIFETPLNDACAHGTFFAPRAYVIDRLDRLEREVFGPILHVIRYRADRLGAVLDAIAATGYGLTLGVHSRIDDVAQEIAARVRVGNIYINRNIIGAVVGVQPFGGEGLSGTGPKAGGPFYLHRFAVERAVSIDLTAQGGNASLLTLGDAG